MSVKEKLPAPLIKAYSRVIDPGVIEQGDIIRYCPDAKQASIDVKKEIINFDFNEFKKPQNPRVFM